MNSRAKSHSEKHLWVLFLGFLFIILASSIWVQTPQKLSYLDVLRDTGKALLILTNLGVQLSVLQDGANGSAYSESYNTSTNPQGLFTLEIGLVNVITKSLSAIYMGQYYYELKATWPKVTSPKLI